MNNFSKVKVSVCMATYNGEKFIVEQVDSILKQLHTDDELIIVDDCSSDNTAKIVESITDSRIKLYRNDRNRSHVYTFGKALSISNNEVVFMADQDDLWIDGRVELMVDYLRRTGKLLVSSNSKFMDQAGKGISFPIKGVKASDSGKHFKNIIAIFEGITNYYGCAMALNRRLLQVILPIPLFVESHDLWIAMAGNMMRSNVHLDEKTFIRRVHNNNASIVERSFFRKVWSRIIFLLSMLTLTFRIVKLNIVKSK